MAPDDAGNGLAMRMGMFLEALKGLGELEVILLPVFGPVAADSPLCQRLGIRPHLVQVSGRTDTHFSILSSIADPQTRLEAFIRYGQPSVSSYLSVPVQEEIHRFASERSFDLVHVARSYLLPVINAWLRETRPIVSVDLDEDDRETHRRIAGLHAIRGDDFMAKWLEAEALAFDRVIAQWLPQTDLSFIATQQECVAIAQRHGVCPTVITNTVAMPSVRKRNPLDHSLLFVGGFGYFPNLDAAYWLLETVLPELMGRLDCAVPVTMVGSNAPKRLMALAKDMGVAVIEHAGDLAPIYARASIALVPLRAGGGSRIKLLEAAAHRVPVVATIMGAENSGLEDGRHIWIADTPRAIVEACLTIWQAPEEAARRADSARQLVETFHSRPVMISTLKTRFANHIANLAEH